MKNAATVARRWPEKIHFGDATRAAIQGVFELLFPGSCVSCGTELDAGQRPVADMPFCRECYGEFELIAGPTCRQCGAPVPLIGAGRIADQAGPPTRPDCYRCRGRKLWFDETLAAGLYTGRIRELLLRMKQSEGDPLSMAIGRLIWHERRERLEVLEPDVVAPIPLHWRRRIAHRTNSAAILAEVLSRHLHAPLAEGLLRRRRHTKPQFTLTPTQRWQNVRQAFSIGGGQHLNQAHVLLVDDILTTGATCSEAARALKKAGAARVTVVVAARAIT